MIAIVNYGMGNLRSIQNALRWIGIESRITDDEKLLREAAGVILPGVGSFRKAMQTIRERRIDVVLRKTVTEEQKPLLGICLGMQLLADRGDEDGPSEGLGWIPGEVRKISPDSGDLKVPHVGFNAVQTKGDHLLFRNMPRNPDFYFVHSYAFHPADPKHVTGTIEYGGALTAAVSSGNICGVQFHPEKSQSNGLQMLKNWCLSLA